MGTILKTYPTVCRVVNVWAIKGNVMTMAMTETRLASVENKNFFFEFQQKKSRESFPSLSWWKRNKIQQLVETLWHFLRHWKVFLKEKKKNGEIFCCSCCICCFVWLYKSGNWPKSTIWTSQQARGKYDA